jgi:hypothetical protein
LLIYLQPYSALSGAAGKNDYGDTRRKHVHLTILIAIVDAST